MRLLPGRDVTLRTAAVGVLAAALVLGGCGADDADPESGPSTAPRAADPTTESETGSTPPTSPTSEPEQVPAALDFSATTVTGEEFRGASVAGRPVVLWFWAPWCAVCRSQVPEVTGLSEDYGDRVAFVGVGSLDGAEAIAGFADDVPGLTHLSDPDGDLYQRFGVSEQSSFVVLDAAGEEVLRTGYADDDELAGTVEDLAG